MRKAICWYTYGNLDTDIYFLVLVNGRSFFNESAYAKKIVVREVVYPALRLGGESIPVTASTEKECVRQAWAVKAEYLVGKRRIAEKNPKGKTPNSGRGGRPLHRAPVQSEISSNTEGLQHYPEDAVPGSDRWASVQYHKGQWEDAINQEAGVISPKTIFQCMGIYMQRLA